jgi:hypothetical protein
VRVPAAPELTPTSVAWAVALAVGIYVGTALLYFVWRPLVFVPNVALLSVVAYLILGELWNGRGSA